MTIYSLHPWLPSTFQPDGSQLILSLSPTSFSLNSSIVIHPLHTHTHTHVCTHFQSHDRCSCNSHKTVNNFRLKKVGSLMEQFRFEKNLLERFNDRILRNWNPGKKGKRREERKFCKLEVNSGRKKGLRLRSRMFRKMKFGRNLGGREGDGEFWDSRIKGILSRRYSVFGNRWSPPPETFYPAFLAQPPLFAAGSRGQHGLPKDMQTISFVDRGIVLSRFSYLLPLSRPSIDLIVQGK